MPTQVTKTMGVVVANARIEGGATLTPIALLPLTVARGTKVQLQVPWELSEASKQKEEYQFSLQCTVGRLGSKEAPRQSEPVAVRWGDKWGRRDERHGTLQQVYEFNHPGDYGVTYEIVVDYARLEWGGSRVEHGDRKVQTGRLAVHVAA